MRGDFLSIDFKGGHSWENGVHRETGRQSRLVRVCKWQVACHRHIEGYGGIALHFRVENLGKLYPSEGAALCLARI